MKAAAAIALLALLTWPACRRPNLGASPELRAELVGGWLRDAPMGVEGFDLRADGSVGLIGSASMNAIAWTVSRNELVISTSTEHRPTPNPSRLEIVSLERDVLTLRADPPDQLAGTWRRGTLERVSGVVTYLERRALPADARVEVRLLRGGRLLARTLIAPKGPVPIPFALSYLPATAPEATSDELEASIFASGRPLFGSAEPSGVEAGATGVELLVRLSR